MYVCVGCVYIVCVSVWWSICVGVCEGCVYVCGVFMWWVCVVWVCLLRVG